MSTYSSDSIKILEGLEHIRTRPHMYIGNTGSEGLHHLLREVVDNAIDEYLDGHCSTIFVRIRSDTQYVEVRDNGRGIPVTKHKKANKSTLEAVFSILHSGGKFGKGAYTGTVVGLHGIGVKAVNALSNKFIVYTVAKNNVWKVIFNKGSTVKPPHKITTNIPKNFRRGTIVKFVPDDSIFSAKWNKKIIYNWLYTTACLCPGLKIYYQFDQEKHVLKSENGIYDILKTIVSEDFNVRIDLSDDSFEACLVWSPGISETWQSFVNVVKTINHGTHVNGLKKAIQDSVNEVASDNIRGDFVRSGLAGVIHAKVNNPEFSGQTKTKLENTEVYNIIYERAKDLLVKFWVSNKDLLDFVVGSAKKAEASWSKLQNEKKAIKTTKIKKGAIGILPGKLVEAPYCTNDIRELYICEGDSAEGIVTKARKTIKIKGKNIHYQEVYPLRGKLPNTIRSKDLSIITKNNTIKDLVTIIGTGVGNKFDITKCRYKRIYLLADADPDGRHIIALLLSLFTNYMPGIISSGRLFVIQNPLFMGVTEKARVYGNSVEEVKSKINSDKFIIRRFKGLGESNPEELQEYAMNDETRKTIKVGWDDNSIKILQNYMGADAQIRKVLLGL